jgi:hypothetical protein
LFINIIEQDFEKRAPITVKFEIPYFTVSGIQVRYLKIVEKSGYQALPWVRYITQNGDDYRSVDFSFLCSTTFIDPFLFKSADSAGERKCSNHADVILIYPSLLLIPVLFTVGHQMIKFWCVCGLWRLHLHLDLGMDVHDNASHARSDLIYALGYIGKARCLSRRRKVEFTTLCLKKLYISDRASQTLKMGVVAAIAKMWKWV